MILGAFLFVGGVWHCIYNSYKYSVRCDEIMCKFQHNDFRNVNTPRELTINRAGILDSAMVDLNVATGEVFSYGTMNNSKNSKEKVGYNLRLTINEGSSEKYMTLSPYDLGRGQARTASFKFSLYLKQKKHKVSFHHGKNVTFAGFVSIVLSIVGFILVAIFGQWEDATAADQRRLKKRT